LDLLFLTLFLVFAGFFLVLGSWRRVALISFIGVTFLILACLFILGSGVEVVSGTATTWSNYSAFSNETIDGINTTISGTKFVANTFTRLPTNWEMIIVTVLLALSIYLSYSAWVGMNESNKEY
jgi:hypothetical protein